MWLVIHIPKTAGTSFRWALEKQFGKSQVVRDYGPDSKDTSEVVQRYLYTEPGSSRTAELMQELSGGDTKILMGHFPLQKYANYFEPENIIAFVRDPLIRLCSEYLHRSDNESYKGSFSEYLQKPGSQELQSWFLNGVSEQTIIGVTDQYRESLNIINSAFGWGLKARKKNVTWLKGGQKFSETLSVQELEKFNTMNKKDLELYQIAKQRFATD